jgi:hypothetical protein
MIQAVVIRIVLLLVFEVDTDSLGECAFMQVCALS